MRVVFLLMLLILIGVVLLSFWSYMKAFYNKQGRKRDASVLPKRGPYEAVKDKVKPLIEEMENIQWEEVFIYSRDGLRLFGKYNHVSDGAPLHIQFHGYKGSAYRDFCGGNKLARDMGHNTLVVDQRAHGKSEGHTISFGIKERFDCLDWIEYVNGRFGENTDIIISGLSMGASTVLMAANEPLPQNVRAIIADCPYSSPADIIMKVCADIGLPPKPSIPFAYLGAKLFGGFDLYECDAVSGAEKSKIPILIIHGEGDDFVPPEMSLKIAHANPQMVKYVTFPEAGHGLSYMKDEERYVAEVSDFIKGVIKEDSPA